MKNISSKEIWSSIQFQKQMANHLLWLDKAKELIKAAHLLEEAVDKDWSNALATMTQNNMKDVNVQTSYPIIQDIQSMLYSYAVENYFKAIIIYCSPALHNANKLPRAIHTHELLQLAKSAKFSVDEKETELLLRLQRNAEWQGRYPVPSEYNKIGSIREIDRKQYFLGFFSSSDRTRINKLIERITSYVKSIIVENI